MNKLSLGTKILTSEFKSRGYKIYELPIGNNFIKISKNNKSILIKGSNPSIDFALNALIAKSKKFVNYFCRENNIPVPKQIVCNNLNQVKKAVKKIKFPVVIKPIDQAHGINVVVNINDIAQLLIESKFALQKYSKIVVEKFVRGEDYRLLVIDNKFVSAVHRTTAKVVGDGKNSIRKLISIENKNPLRGIGYTKPLLKIEIDEETEKLLIKNEYTLDEIVEKNKIIYLKETPNASKGGETQVVTKKVHKSYIDLAEKAARVIGLKYAGIDIITRDITCDIKSARGYLIEVNCFPGIDMHQYPSRGKGDNVGKPIVDMIEKYCFNNRNLIPSRA